MLKDLEWTLDFPVVIPGIVMMGRDRDNHSGCLRSFEQAAEIGNDIVLGDALAHDWPCLALRAHEIDLWINNDQGCPGCVQLHAPFRESRVRSEEHTSELQSRQYLVCRLLLEKKKNLP